MSSQGYTYDWSRLMKIKKVRVLGAGSYGVVYLAHYEGYSHCKFAMKSAMVSSKEARSLEKEKRVYLSLLPCPGIARCFMDAFTLDLDDREIYYSLYLDFAPAGTLYDILKRNTGRGFPEQSVGAYVRMILVGLRNMHSKGYVHCDLKPENILAFHPANGPGPYELKLADFGLATEPDRLYPAEVWKGRFRGTPRYMSPESVKDGRISWRLDIWSLGWIVLQMLNGWATSLPAERVVITDELIMDMLNDKEFDPMALAPKSMSETGRSFLRKCLHRDPMKRWPAHRLLEHPYLALDVTPVSTSDVPQTRNRHGGRHASR